MKKYLILLIFAFGFDGCPADMEQDVKRAELEVNTLKLEISVDMATEKYESACKKRNKVVKIGRDMCLKYKEQPQCLRILSIGTLDCSKYKDIPVDMPL